MFRPPPACYCKNTSRGYSTSRVSFAPAAYEVTLEKLGVAPKDAAAVGTASPECMID